MKKIVSTDFCKKLNENFDCRIKNLLGVHAHFRTAKVLSEQIASLLLIAQSSLPKA